jgi:PII-like signaling protein
MKRFLGEKKVARIYIDNQDKHHGKPLWEEILKRAKKSGLAGATVFKGISGIGVGGEIHSFNVWSISQKLPLVIEIIDDEKKVLDFLEMIDDIVDEGMTTLGDTEVIRYKHRQ